MKYIDNFIEIIKTQYADFGGRTSRSEFWTYVLIYWIGALILSILDIRILTIFYEIILFVPSIAITARRLHDTDRSGWYQVLFLIPLVGWLILLFFLIDEGDMHANKFGEAPTTQTKEEASPSTENVVRDAEIVDTNSK